MTTRWPDAAGLFVRRRPRYPLGTTIGGFPPVQAVLFADGDCEVYRLDRIGARDTLLVSTRAAPDGVAPSCERVVRWLERHGCETLALPFRGADGLDVVVRVNGTWMAEIPTLPLMAHELRALLTALIDLAADAAFSDLTAVPTRPLLWMDGPPHHPRLACVHVRTGREDEAEVVRQIGRTFLTAATGIASVETAKMPDEIRLGAWCQNADAELSNVVARCIGPRDPIRSLTHLRERVAACLARAATACPRIAPAADRFVAVGPNRVLWRRRSGFESSTLGRA